MNELDTTALAMELSKHHPTKGVKVAMGFTCACGYWSDGNYRQSFGSDGLDFHRAEVAAKFLEDIPVPVVGEKVYLTTFTTYHAYFGSVGGGVAEITLTRKAWKEMDEAPNFIVSISDIDSL